MVLFVVTMGFPFQIMQPKIEAFRQHLLKDPAIADVTGSSGGDMGISNSWMRVRLKPLAERKISAQQVVDRIRATAPKVPGGMVFLNVDQDIRLSSPFGRSDYELLMLSGDLQLLRKWSKQVAEKMQELPGAGGCGYAKRRRCAANFTDDRPGSGAAFRCGYAHYCYFAE